MNIEYIKNLSPAERKSLLEGDAISIEETKYTKPLTPEEVSYYKDQLAENSIQQAIILDELKDVKDTFKIRLAPLAVKIKESLQAVKFKAIDCEGILYKLADFDDKMVHTVDADGNLITSRQMQPSERQFTISSSLKQKAS